MKPDEIRQDPILIASPTRCGTTMLAWLLHLHGVWIGKSGVTKAPETNPQVGTENTELKNYLKHGVAGDIPLDFRKQIARRVETTGPWLLKTAGNLLQQDAWLQHFPDARWVLPFRDFDDIIESAMRHPGFAKAGRARRRQIAAQHIELQYRVAERAKHVIWVDVDKIGRGNISEAQKLFDFCEIPLDAGVFISWIDPGRWHGGA